MTSEITDFSNRVCDERKSRHVSKTRCGFRLKVRTEKIAEYVAAHDQVWTPMLEALSRQGWKHYSLFIDESTGDVFGYFESDDCLASMAAMEDEEADRIWQSRMAQYFVSPNGGESHVLKQYFYLA